MVDWTVIAVGISLALLTSGLVAWLRADVRDLRSELRDQRSEIRGLRADVNRNGEAIATMNGYLRGNAALIDGSAHATPAAADPPGELAHRGIT